MKSNPGSEGLSSLIQKIGLTFTLSGTGVLASFWDVKYSGTEKVRITTVRLCAYL